MFHLLYGMSDAALFLFLMSFFIGISIVGVVVVNYFVPLDIRYRDNAVIGNVSALISIIYGVLAGLMALYLINNVNAAEFSVQNEATAVANLYRDSKFLKEPTRSVIQMQIKNYLQTVINNDWPLMQKEEDVGNQGDVCIQTITDALVKYNGTNNAEGLLLHDMLDEIKRLYDSRQERIHMSELTLNNEIWFVIGIGTILIIIVNYMFGMNIYLHLASVIAVAIMAVSMIFLLVTLDKPFEGEFAVSEKPFRVLLDYINKSGLGNNP